MIVVKMVYELEPGISSCIAVKTRCQASHSGSEPTESGRGGRPASVVARRVVAGNGRTSPVPRRVWLGQARARLNITRTRPHCQSTPFTSPRPPSLPQRQLSSSRLRRRNSQLKLALSRPFVTTTASPPSQRLPTPASTRFSSLVSRSTVQMLTEAPPPAPSLWPHRHRLPEATIER